jgi:gas vesicle protein
MPENTASICAIVNTRLCRRRHRVQVQEHKHVTDTNADAKESRHYGFVIGLVTGTVAGAGLMMWLAPRTASEVRKRLTDSARNLGNGASEQYQQASTRVGKAVDELTQKGQDVRDDVAEAVARGAHEVQGYATAAKTDHVAEARKHSAAHRSA